MSIKENKYVKKIIDNQKMLIEMFFVAFIGGFAFANIINRSYAHAGEKQFSANVNLILFIIEIVLAAAVIAASSFFKKVLPKLIMFALVMIFFIAAAYNTTSVSFAETTKNPIGQVSLLALFGFLAVAVFLYIREDLFKLSGRVKLSTKALKIITGVFLALIFGVVAFIGIMRYRTYSNATFDFGIFAQMYEYMKQKGLIETTVERGYLLSHNAVHVSPIFYVGLPLYFIFPYAETIAIIQAIFVALPVIPIYLLGKHFELKNKVIVGLIALYAFYPATVSGTFYDIHENTFLTFTLLMFIWAVEKKKNIPTAVFLVLSFMVKEDAPIYIMLLGAFWVFSRKDKTRGAIFIVLAAIYFAIALAIINGYGLGGFDFRYDNMMYDSKGGLGQILIVFLTNPAYAFSQFIANADANNMDKFAYLIAMFAPIAALVFSAGKKYSRYILFGAFVIISLVTTYPYQHDIGFQYNVGHIALLFYLIMMNLKGISVRKQKTRVWAGVIIALIMFVGIVWPRTVSYGEKMSNNKVVENYNKAVESIPRDATVLTTGFLMPHLHRNLELYDIGYPQELRDEAGNVVDKKYVENPDYIIVDSSIGQEEQAILDEKYLNSGNYELTNPDNTYAKVYKRNK